MIRSCCKNKYCGACILVYLFSSFSLKIPNFNTGVTLTVFDLLRSSASLGIIIEYLGEETWANQIFFSLQICNFQLNDREFEFGEAGLLINGSILREFS